MKLLVISQYTQSSKNKEEILKVLSKSGVYTILSALNKKSMRFSQLMFKTRLNPGVLDRHLKSLIKLEIVEKNNSHYALTPKGEKILEALDQIFKLHSNFYKNFKQ